MAWVLPEILCPINDVPLAPEVVYSVGDTLSIDTLLSTHPEVFVLLETVGVFDTCLEHLTRLLAKLWVLLMTRLEVFLPGAPDKRCHIVCTNY